LGWLLGAGIGFMFGGPLGAVVGGALQHVLAKGTQLSSTGRVTAPRQEQVFITYLVAILAKICMADGTISEAERKTIHSFFSRVNIPEDRDSTRFAIKVLLRAFIIFSSCYSLNQGTHITE